MQPENVPDSTALEPTTIEREPAIISTGPVEGFLAEVKERSRLLKEVKQLALEHSTENDWVLMSGPRGPVPYLQATGCEKIGRLFGVRLSAVISQATRKANGHYVWEFQGIASMRSGDSIEVFGSRDSEDPFFSTRYQYDPEQKRRVPVEVPPEDISERDVKMAAYSNFFVNAVSRLLGLRGFTVDQLIKAGLDPKKMPGVEYKQAATSPSSRRGDSSPAPRGGKDAEPEPDASEVKVKLWGLMRQIKGTDKKVLADFLEEITAFEGKDGPVAGVRTFANMKPRRMGVTLDRLRKAVEAGEHEIRFDEKGKPLS